MLPGQTSTKSTLETAETSVKSAQAAGLHRSLIIARTPARKGRRRDTVSGLAINRPMPGGKTSPKKTELQAERQDQSQRPPKMAAPASYRRSLTTTRSPADTAMPARQSPAQRGGIDGEWDARSHGWTPQAVEGRISEISDDVPDVLGVGSRRATRQSAWW